MGPITVVPHFMKRWLAVLLRKYPILAGLFTRHRMVSIMKINVKMIFAFWGVKLTCLARPRHVKHATPEIGKAIGWHAFHDYSRGKHVALIL
jgi:hypothetical protein